MYQPLHFREDRIEVLHGLIRSNPLGLLVTAGRDGLMANAIPFLVDGAPGPFGTLRAHVARANPQWREIEAAECLMVFQGPQAYVTPGWYATKRETGKVVPTWNYATVHAWGRGILRDDAAWIAQQIADLTAEQERSRSEPWTVDDAPAPFIAAQIKGIVGIEIPITRIEGKWKVSQNRSDADRNGVIEGLRHEGRDDSAALVAARGAVGR